MVYKILDYPFLFATSPISQTIEVPKDYKVLSVVDTFTTGSNFGFLEPYSYPTIQIAVNEDSVGTVNLVFTSIQGGDGTFSVTPESIYVGSYSITDSDNFTLWYFEEQVESDIPDENLVLWLRADGGMNRDEITNKVNQWQDNSNRGNNFYNDNIDDTYWFEYIAEGATNNLPTLSGNNGDTYLQSYYTSDFDEFPSGISMFFVTKPAPFNSNYSLLNFGASGDGLNDSFSITVNTDFTGSSTVKFTAYQDIVESSLESLVLWDDHYQLLEVTHDGIDTAKLYANGNLIATGLVDPIVSSPRIYNFLGRDILNISGSYYGEIAEVIIYKEELIDSDRRLVEAYLNQKYNLGSIKPQIIPPGQNVEGSDNVTVTILTPAGTPTYWTNDGSDPTAASTLYTGPFEISYNSFIKAKAIGKFGPSQIEKALIIVGSGGA